MRDNYDMAVIGAGPAGLAAASTAADLGLATIILDEHPGPGGQIYRNVDQSPLSDPGMLGPDYRHGEQLVQAIDKPNIDYLAQATVWQLSRDREIGIRHQEAVRFLSVPRIIVATGALERPLPIPGWTLPGVMTAGAGQVLIKSAGMVPDAPVVLAGCGPLLLLLAWQYIQADVQVAAVLDTTPRANYLAALRQLPQALLAPEYLIKGIKLIRAIGRAGIPMISGVTALRAVGTEHLEAVEYQRSGRKQAIETPLLLLHQGVIPNVQITRALGCQHVWDEAQLCWRPQTDPWGNTDIEGIAVAGDGSGIIGALASEHMGRLTALEAAYRLGRLSQEERDRRAAPERARLRHHQRVRPFLDTLYRPTLTLRRPEQDDTIVCRCEEITAGEIRRMVELGCTGPNQTKSFTRCGMGPCQGRICGLTVAEIIAEARGVGVAEVGYYRIRPPIKPITLGELANAAVLSTPANDH